MKKNYKSFIISIAIALLVGGISAFITRNSMDVYGELNTPPLAPPGILFPIVWTVLYVLMGISAAIIFNIPWKNKQKQTALRIYAASLFVNFTWSIIFFNFRAFLFSFIWLILLFALIIKTITAYKELNKTAAYLQIPYAVWVAFAGYLNFGIWILNK